MKKEVTYLWERASQVRASREAIDTLVKVLPAIGIPPLTEAGAERWLKEVAREAVKTPDPLTSDGKESWRYRRVGEDGIDLVFHVKWDAYVKKPEEKTIAVITRVFVGRAQSRPFPWEKYNRAKAARSAQEKKK